MKSGITVEFCAMTDTASRLLKRDWYSKARRQGQLGIPEDLRLNAIVQGHTDSGTSQYSIARISLQGIALRSAMATRYSADAAYDSVDDLAYLKAHEFFWVDNAQLDVRIARPKDGDERMSFHMDARVPYIRAHMRLLHVYCTLLVISTLRKLNLRSRQEAAVGNDRSASFSLKANIGKCQFIATMPLRTRIYCCISNFAVDSSESSERAVIWRLFQMFVPSPSAGDLWEEMLTIRASKVLFHHEPYPTSIVFSGETVRIFIPYNYIAADLILDCSVMFKAIRHLTKVIPEGLYRPLDEPGAESAARIPNIRIFMNCLLIEFADDPLESKLALIWKAGFGAAATRLERNEAFEEKVAVIEAAEQYKTGSDPSSQSDSRFSMRHTVPVEEALNRLYQVHAISWASSLQEHRGEQRNREDKIRAQYRADSSFSLFRYDSPELVRVKPSSRSPPLLRIVLDTFTMSATPLGLSVCDLAEYLHDVGKGIPRDTTYNLLVPTQLKFNIGATTVSLRDYTIPLLHIPRAHSPDKYSWTIETTLVVGEELGSAANVIWKCCEIVPDGADNAASKGFSLLVPKTTMPVKTYATPDVKVHTAGITQLCWGISYNPTIQDVMRVVDSLTLPPADPSPNIGFWDKASSVFANYRISLIIVILGSACTSLESSNSVWG